MSNLRWIAYIEHARYNYMFSEVASYADFSRKKIMVFKLVTQSKTILVYSS